MSYKANPKSIRLGISHDWEFKNHGKKSEFHFENKIKTFINSLVDYVVPQAPTKVKTKGTQIRGFPIQPGMQGRTIISRSQNEVNIMLYFYLSYDGATEKQIEIFESSIHKMAILLHKETKYTIRLKVLNYFMIWWRYELFLGINCPKRLLNKIKRCILSHKRLVIEQREFSRLKKDIKYIRYSLRKFRRNRFFKRTIYPVISAFLFFEFDSNLAAKLIALELQILRKYHKKFIYYIESLFKVCFKKWTRQKNMQGLMITITGRTTNFRRQVRRTQKKIIRIGSLKRNYLATESGHSLQLSYNRYGVISVQVSYQMQPLIAVKRSEWFFSSSITHFFSIKKMEEDINKASNSKINFFEYIKTESQKKVKIHKNICKRTKFFGNYINQIKQKLYKNRTQPVLKHLKESRYQYSIIKKTSNMNKNIHSKSFLNWINCKKKNKTYQIK